MTVCAFPNSDLLMIAVRLPCSRASMAARTRAPRAQITTRSSEGRWTVGSAGDAPAPDGPSAPSLAEELLEDSLMFFPVVFPPPSVHKSGISKPARRHRHDV